MSSLYVDYFSKTNFTIKEHDLGCICAKEINIAIKHRLKNIIVDMQEYSELSYVNTNKIFNILKSYYFNEKLVGLSFTPMSTYKSMIFIDYLCGIELLQKHVDVVYHKCVHIISTDSNLKLEDVFDYQNIPRHLWSSFYVLLSMELQSKRGYKINMNIDGSLELVKNV